jgi:hypothetical protein
VAKEKPVLSLLVGVEAPGWLAGAVEALKFARKLPFPVLVTSPDEFAVWLGPVVDGSEGLLGVKKLVNPGEVAAPDVSF